jgi:hypothetical protein
METFTPGARFPGSAVPVREGLHAQDAKAHSVVSIALVGSSDGEFASAHSVILEPTRIPIR